MAVTIKLDDGTTLADLRMSRKQMLDLTHAMHLAAMKFINQQARYKGLLNSIP